MTLGGSYDQDGGRSGGVFRVPTSLPPKTQVFISKSGAERTIIDKTTLDNMNIYTVSMLMSSLSELVYDSTIQCVSVS